MGNKEISPLLDKIECYKLDRFKEETPRKMTIHILCDKDDFCRILVENLTGEQLPQYSEELLEINIKRKINLFSFMNYYIY